MSALRVEMGRGKREPGAVGVINGGILTHSAPGPEHCNTHTHTRKLLFSDNHEIKLIIIKARVEMQNMTFSLY